MTFHPPARLIATLIGGLVLLAGCAASSPGSQPTRVASSTATTAPAGSYDVVSNHRSYPSAGIVVGPPPAGSQPATTPSQALATCTTGAVVAGDLLNSGPAPCPNLSPDAIEFGSFTDNSYGTIQADNSVHHPYQNTRAWIMTWHNAPCPPSQGPGDGSAAAQTCQWLIFVSADTGQYLDNFEGGDPAVVTP